MAEVDEAANVPSAAPPLAALRSAASPRGRGRHSEEAAEVVVLVDDFGRPAGFADSLAAHRGSSPLLHLAVSCFLLDDSGRVLLTRRAPTLRFPRAWTTSTRGHVAPAETADHAVARHVADDLGMRLVGLRLILPAFRHRTDEHEFAEHELCPVFVGRAQGEVRPNAARVSDAAWVSWPRLRDDVLFGRRAVSGWCTRQVAGLSRYDDDPRTWPAAPPGRLPPAMRHFVDPTADSTLHDAAVPPASSPAGHPHRTAR